MTKFLAVLKREYIQRVRARMFIVSTVLLPVVMSLFGIVPALVLNINAGGPMRAGRAESFWSRDGSPGF
jgi:hypothetical protein